MASDEPSAEESRITTDPEQIESWARETNAVPVRSGGRLRIVDEGEFDEDRHERVDWDEFESEIRDSDRVVVYREDRDRNQLEVRHREDAMTHLEGEEVEERLIGGEVVTGTVSETAVVERTIVEEAEIESEVVDSEIVDRQAVDAELLSRECSTCTIQETGGDGYLDRYGAPYFLGEGEDDQLASQEDLTFEFDVDEAWSVTIEERERFTVESSVTNVDVEETDAVQDMDLEADVDFERFHEQLLASNLFEVDVRDLEDAETEAVESEVHEGDTIQTTLTRNRTLDREVAMSHDVTATATESRRTNVQTAHEEVVAGGLAEGDREAAAGTATAETGEGVGRTEPTGDDEGKTVVDATGEEIGVVTEVEAGRAYVDPHPSLTEKVMAKLGWGEADEEDYAVEPSQIARVTDDEVELVGEE